MAGDTNAIVPLVDDSNKALRKMFKEGDYDKKCDLLKELFKNKKIDFKGEGNKLIF